MQPDADPVQQASLDRPVFVFSPVHSSLLSQRTVRQGSTFAQTSRMYYCWRESYLNY